MDNERPSNARVGAMVEAHCTKCRKDTRHRVTAVEGKKVKKAECQACGAVHAYRPPKFKREEPPAKAKKPAAAKKPLARPSAAEKAPEPKARQKAAPAAPPAGFAEDDLADAFEGLDELLDSVVEEAKPKRGAKPKAGAASKGSAKEPAREPKPKPKAKARAKREDFLGDELEEDEDVSLIQDMLFSDGDVDSIDADPFADDLDIDLDSGAVKPKPKAKARAPKAAVVKKTKEQKRQDEMRAIHGHEWHYLTKSENAEKVPVYETSGTYGLDENINHTTFGIGYVVKVVPPNKIHVKFESDTKVLVTGRP